MNTPVVNTAMRAADHFTLTNVVRTTEKTYAFASNSVTGQDVFIPASVTTRADITEDQVGHGFRALLRDNPSEAEGLNHPLVCYPLLFDTNSLHVDSVGLDGAIEALNKAQALIDQAMVMLGATTDGEQENQHES